MAVSLAVRLTIPPGLEVALGAFQPPRIGNIFGRTLNRVGLDVQTIATTKHMRGPRPAKLGQITGDLRRSIRVDRGHSPRFVEVGSDLVYAPVHEFGAKINAKGGGFLTFKLRDGTFRKVRSVTIPARPYLQPALDEASKRGADILFQEISREVG